MNISVLLALVAFAWLSPSRDLDEQLSQGALAKPVPYTVTYDQKGQLIRIAVAPETDKDQLRATLASVADKHRDDPARDYVVLDYLQVEAYFETESQISAVPAGRLKRYVPPLPPNARAGAKTKPDEFTFHIASAKKSLRPKQPSQLPSRTAQADGQWSRAAVAIPHLVEKREIASPDGHRSITFTGTTLSLWERAANRPSKLIGSVQVDRLGEVLWSRDSNAVAITTSDGGWVGTWNVVVLQIVDGSLKESSVTADTLADFSRRHPCPGRPVPNVAAVSWLQDSSRLLLLAEVSPASPCAEMGLIMGYAVSVPSGKIGSSYNEKVVREKFGCSLGPRRRYPQE